MPRVENGPRTEVDFWGKVRTRDLETSWDAAARQTNTKTKSLQDDIEWILQNAGPLTDDEIGKHYRMLIGEQPFTYQWATPQSLRTRRSELVAQGRVVGTTEKRPSDNGGPSTVWMVHP